MAAFKDTVPPCLPTALVAIFKPVLDIWVVLQSELREWEPGEKGGG